MKISKQEIIKLGVTLAMLIIAITLTMVFTRGTVDVSRHEATLHARYDYMDENNITHTYFTEVNFTFVLNLTSDHFFPPILDCQF